MLLLRMRDSRSDRKLSFCAVLSTMGRERLMCRGWGMPRSEARKDVMGVLFGEESDGEVRLRLDWRVERRVVRVSCSVAVGCPVYSQLIIII